MNMSLAKKIGGGFGIIIIMLCAIAIWAIFGIRGIVDNANEVIEGNKLVGDLVQKEVDHLNWANQVNQLLTDESVTELDVQTDDHLCAFGKWLYGEGRQQAIELVPSLAPILTEIEGPHHELHTSAIAIGDVFVQANAALPGIFAAREVDHLKWADQLRDCFLMNKKVCEVEANPTRCALGKWLAGPEAQAAYDQGNAEFKHAWDNMLIAHRNLHETATEIAITYKQRHPGLRQLLLNRLLDHKDWAEKVSKAIIEGNSDLGVQTDPAKCAYGKFLASEQCKKYEEGFPALRDALAASVKPHDELHASAISISKALASGAEGKTEAEKIFQEKTIPALTKVGNYFDEAISAETVLVDEQNNAKEIFEEKTVPLLHETLADLDELKDLSTLALKGMDAANAIYARETMPNLHQTQKFLEELRDTCRANIMTDAQMLAAASRTNWVVSIVSIIAAFVGIILAIVIARGIIGPVKRVITGLSSGSDQVTSAAGQISSSSQEMAEGSSEQASNLEEISSSLEEMTSMTRQNADNAKQASGLMDDASSVVSKGMEATERMSAAVSEIKQSSDETAKIIKTIDEIAFQTNLLALNAAVEAARAGEAGKGFAVVAEEVRNLAQRSAEAAKNTADLIEGSQKNSDRGVAVTEEVAGALKQIVDSSSKVGQLIGEVSAASSEQAQGIDQVNTAVAEMDKVVQQNAANAEESASASEELSSQAMELNNMVGDLSLIVDGSSTDTQQRTYAAPPAHRQTAPAHKPALAAHKPAPMKRKANTAKPEEVIPLDDDDFSEF